MPTPPDPDAGSIAVTAPYAEHPPSAALRRWVECYWTRSGWIGGALTPHRILPDGAMDIILDLSAGPAARDPLYAVGTMTRALVLPRRPGRIEVFGVRFRPGGARRFLGVPAGELTDLRVSIADLWRDAARVVERLVARAGSAMDPAAVAHELDRMLLARLGGAAEPDRLVEEAVRRIVGTAGRVAVGDLTAELGVSRQHLARRFAEEVGVAPKMLARIARVQAVVRRIARDPAADWSGVALDAGYYDQAHLIGDFRELTGLTPGQYRDESR